MPNIRPYTSSYWTHSSFFPSRKVYLTQAMPIQASLYPRYRKWLTVGLWVKLGQEASFPWPCASLNSQMVSHGNAGDHFLPLQCGDNPAEKKANTEKERWTKRVSLAMTKIQIWEYHFCSYISCKNSQNIESMNLFFFYPLSEFNLNYFPLPSNHS